MILLLLLPLSIYSGSNNTELTIVATGIANTFEKSKELALRIALEQAYGTYVSSKTELVNDQISIDKISTLTNGMIKSYEVLASKELTDNKYSTTLKVEVSLKKINEPITSKQTDENIVAIDVNSQALETNLKQQSINEESEIEIVKNMIEVAHDLMQQSFEYKIRSTILKHKESNKDEWEIDLVVSSVANPNMDVTAKYIINTLEMISLSSREKDSYENLRKKYYGYIIRYNGESYRFSFRSESSINSLNNFKSYFPLYSRRFVVSSNIDTYPGSSFSYYSLDWSPKSNRWEKQNRKMDWPFLISGDTAFTYIKRCKNSINQIESIKSYVVKSDFTEMDYNGNEYFNDKLNYFE
jgi:hypothetical protein